MNATGFLRRQEIYFFFPLAWLKITLITCVLFPHIQRKICPIHSLILHYATITHIPQSKKGYNISKIAAEVSSSNLKITGFTTGRDMCNRKYFLPAKNQQWQ